MRIKTMQNVSTAKSSKTSEALGIFDPPISCLQDRRINPYTTEPCNREVSSSTLPDMVMVKKPKEPMTIKSMQNVPRAKYSKVTEAIGRIRTTDLLFTRQKEQPLCFRAVLERGNRSETFDSNQVQKQ